MAKKKTEKTENIYDVLVSLSEEKGIELDIIIEKVSAGILRAIEREYPEITPEDNFVAIECDHEKRLFQVIFLRTVVDDEPTYDNEINIAEARTIDPNCKCGDVVRCPMPMGKLGRVAAQSAKQSLKGDIRDIEKSRIIEVFSGKTEEIASAEVIKIDPSGNAIIKISGAEKYETTLQKRDQIPGETIEVGSTISIYVDKIKNIEKRPFVAVSRTHPAFVKRLFEREVPEIADGLVVVERISRDAGSRTKIAVRATSAEIDPIGACIGSSESRISKIRQEINGEKIDLILYDSDPEVFIRNSLAPATVNKVMLLEGEQRSAKVIVPHNQLSLAIGNRGQNARLAAKLTDYKIDITSDENADVKTEEAPVSEAVSEEMTTENAE